MTPRRDAFIQQYTAHEVNRIRTFVMVPDHLGSFRPMLDGETGKPVDFTPRPNPQGRIDPVDERAAERAACRARDMANVLIGLR